MAVCVFNECLDDGENEEESQYYETLPSLLMAISAQYRNEFQNQLFSKLQVSLPQYLH